MPPADDELPTASPRRAGGLRAKVVRGVVVAFLGQGGSKVLRLLSNMIMARLLVPEAFGLMGLVNVVIFGLGMVSDIGIIPSIVQHKRGSEPTFLNTAFTIASIRGVALLGVACLLAYPAAVVYEQPALAWLIPVTAMTSVIAGLGSTNLATASRELVLERLVLIEFASELASLVVKVGHAYVYRSVWALVTGAITAYLVKTILSHTSLPGIRNRFEIEREAARAIFSFGKWIFVSTCITFLAIRTDAIVLGALIDIGTLGVFSLATTLSFVTIEVGGKVVSTVMLPVLAAGAREDRATLHQYFDEARQVVQAAGLFAVVGMALFAPAFFYVFYTEIWHDAGWMVQLQMFAIWFFHLHEAYTKALIAVGDSRSLASANLAKFIATVVFGVAGYNIASVAGFIMGVGIGALVGHGYVVWRLHHIGLPTLRKDLRWSALTALLGGGGAIVPYVIAPYVDLPVQLVTMGFGFVIVVPVGVWVARRLRAQVRRSHAREPSAAED